MPSVGWSTDTPGEFAQSLSTLHKWPFPQGSGSKEIAMYEKDANFTTEHAPHASTSGATAAGGATATRAETAPRARTSTATRADSATRTDTGSRGAAGATRADKSTDRTDPKFARESNTMRKMHTWQIAALAIAAAVVVALVVFYL